MPYLISMVEICTQVSAQVSMVKESLIRKIQIFKRLPSDHIVRQSSENLNFSLENAPEAGDAKNRFGSPQSAFKSQLKQLRASSCDRVVLEARSKRKFSIPMWSMWCTHRLISLLSRLFDDQNRSILHHQAMHSVLLIGFSVAFISRRTQSHRVLTTN